MIRVANYETDALLDLSKAAQEAMEKRLLDKYRQGYRGWDEPSRVTNKQLRHILTHNLEQDGFLDVMVIAAILWNRQQPDKEPGKDQEPRKE